MKKINFKLEKNKETVIEEKNINSIINKNKITFAINGIKYTYENNIFTRETKEEIITINFIKETCTIYLKDINQALELKINVIKKEKNNNIESMEYKIETEENIINKISIEYI